MAAPAWAPRLHSGHVAELEAASRTALSSAPPAAEERARRPSDLARPTQRHMPQPVGPHRVPRAAVTGLVCFCCHCPVCPLTSDPEQFVPTIPQSAVLAQNKVNHSSFLKPCFATKGVSEYVWCHVADESLWPRNKQ